MATKQDYKRLREMAHTLVDQSRSLAGRVDVLSEELHSERQSSKAKDVQLEVAQRNLAHKEEEIGSLQARVRILEALNASKTTTLVRSGGSNNNNNNNNNKNSGKRDSSAVSATHDNSRKRARSDQQAKPKQDQGQIIDLCSSDADMQT